MPTRSDVNAVLRHLRGLGFDIRQAAGSGHFRVIDPGTGAWITDVSNTPSDPNFMHQVRRAIEKLGISWETGKRKKHRTKGSHSAVDLDALARAQQMARIKGEREPQLEDLDDNAFKRRILKGYNKNQQEEAIANMAQGTNTARAHRTITRLKKFFEEYERELAAQARAKNPKIPEGKGAIPEFARTAMEVGHIRGLRVWKSEMSAENTVRQLLSGASTGITLWVANALEATMDHLNGMRWDRVPPQKPVMPSADELPPISPPPSKAPSISIEKAKAMLLDTLSEEWGARKDISALLVPEHMSSSMFVRVITELSNEGKMERKRQPDKSALFRRVATVGDIMADLESVLPPKLVPQPIDEPPTVVGLKVPEGTIADRYADVLLDVLRNQLAQGVEDWRHFEPILTRLDRLAGVSDK